MIVRMRIAAVALSLVVIPFLGCSEDEETGSGPVVVELSAKITQPTDGASVSDMVDIVAEAVDDKGIAKVEFFVDAAKIGEDAATPYEIKWNSNGLTHGSAHSIYVVAYDTDNNT